MLDEWLREPDLFLYLGGNIFYLLFDLTLSYAVC
jgi:hypothetical protein